MKLSTLAMLLLLTFGALSVFSQRPRLKYIYDDCDCPLIQVTTYFSNGSGDGPPLHSYKQVKGSEVNTVYLFYHRGSSGGPQQAEGSKSVDEIMVCIDQGVKYIRAVAVEIYNHSDSVRYDYYADTLAFCSGTAIVEHNIENMIGISPNPSTGVFSISGLSSNSVLRLFDLQGREIPCQLEEGKLDLFNQPKGIYQLQIVTDDKVVGKRIQVE